MAIISLLISDPNNRFPPLRPNQETVSCPGSFITIYYKEKPAFDKGIFFKKNFK